MRLGKKKTLFLHLATIGLTIRIKLFYRDIFKIFLKKKKLKGKKKENCKVLKIVLNSNLS